MILEPGGVGSEEESDETRLVVVLGCAAALRWRTSDVVVFAEDVVGALETDDGPVKRVEELRAQTIEDGVFADGVVGALETDDGPVKRVEELRARTIEDGVFADDAVGDL